MKACSHQPRITEPLAAAVAIAMRTKRVEIVNNTINKVVNYELSFDSKERKKRERANMAEM
jgi:hypothetical protein